MVILAEVHPLLTAAIVVAACIVISRLFGSKTKRMVLALERVTACFEQAVEKEEWGACLPLLLQQRNLLHWLATEGDWSSERVRAFIRQRGLALSLVDEAYAAFLLMKLEEVTSEFQIRE